MKRPAAWIAAGTLVPFALFAFTPLILYWFFLSGHNWPLEHRIGLAVAAVAVFVLAGAAIVAGLASLLRRAFGVRGAVAVAWALATTMTGLWPLATLLPAALRLGERAAARLAAWGGAALLLGAACHAAGRLAGVAAAYWPMLACTFLGTGLVLDALRRLDGSAPPHRAFAWAFAALVAASVFLQPAWRVARAEREADEARAALLAAIGSPVRPETMYPGPPPVAEADDPVAALDPAAIKAAKSSFFEMAKMLHLYDERRHPLAPEESAFVREWFASHPDYAAAIDAFSASPVYRSCLPGPASIADTDGSPDVFVEPRALEANRAIGTVLLRARAALAAGDAAAGPDGLARLENLVALLDREPTLVMVFCARAARILELRLLAERIDLWSDDALRALERAADDEVARSPARFRDAIASEIFFGDRAIVNGRLAALGLAAASSILGGGRAYDYWIAADRRAHFRNLAVTWERLNALFAAPAGEPVGDAFERLREDELRRNASQPLLSRMVFFIASDLAAEILVVARNRASFVRAAVAIERYRRDHGAPPPSLAALVPDYLPAVPVDAFSGEPLPYEPGPLEIPEETFPAFADPDALAAKSDAELAAVFGDAEMVSVQRIVDAVNAGAFPDEPDPATRTLPAQTLPGFRLGYPDARGRESHDAVYDFYTPSPAEEPHAKSAEAAE